MKVILNQDVKSLGKKGDMVNVSDGYARNFLFPKNLAVEANATNINTMNQRNDAEQARQQKLLDVAKEMAKRIADLTVVIKVKVGNNGKLFGAITNKEIAECLEQQHGVQIDKKKLMLKDNIKTVGVFDINVKLHTKVTGKFVLKIEQE